MQRSEFAANQPPKPKKIYDGKFVWTNQFNKFVSTCNLKVYTVGRKQVAVAREISENQGPSITNAAETLWLNVILKFGDCEMFETHDGKHFDHVYLKDATASWAYCGSWDDVMRRSKCK